MMTSKSFLLYSLGNASDDAPDASSLQLSPTQRKRSHDQNISGGIEGREVKPTFLEQKNTIIAAGSPTHSFETNEDKDKDTGAGTDIPKENANAEITKTTIRYANDIIDQSTSNIKEANTEGQAVSFLSTKDWLRPKTSANSTEKATTRRLLSSVGTERRSTWTPSSRARPRLYSAPGRLNDIMEMEHEGSMNTLSPDHDMKGNHCEDYLFSTFSTSKGNNNWTTKSRKSKQAFEKIYSLATSTITKSKSFEPKIISPASILTDHNIWQSDDEQDNDGDVVPEEEGKDEFEDLDAIDNSEFMESTSLHQPWQNSIPDISNHNNTQPWKQTSLGLLSQCSGGCDLTKIATSIVRNAPCFWCCGNSRNVAVTHRTILYRLNILCALMAMGQVGAASFLLIVLNSDTLVDRYNSVLDRSGDSTSMSLDLWNLNGSVFFLGVLGVIIFFNGLYTLRVVREVNLRGAVRYLWTMLWILPLQIFVVVSLFDYHRVTDVWVTHWWYLPSMAWFRKVFCEPGTYNTLCVVPIQGGTNYTSEEEWCNKVVNATNCTLIRDDAQNDTTRSMIIFYSCCGIWGIILAVFLMLVIYFLQTIITRDIVQTSREANVPGWMLLPIIGCITVGSIFLFSPSSVIRGSSESTNSQWVGLLYIVSGASFLISAMLGWFIGQFSILNAEDKRTKNIAVICFIGLNVIIILLLSGVFTGSVLLSTSLVDVPLSPANVGRSACIIDTAESCSYCGNRYGIQECPEWTEDDVIKVLSTQYKSSATFAVIFILFAYSAMRYGFILRRGISMYQIDYV